MQLTIQTGQDNSNYPFFNGNLYLTTASEDYYDSVNDITYIAGMIVNSDLTLNTSINLQYLGNLEDNPRFSFQLTDNGITEYLENSENSLIGSLVTIEDQTYIYSIPVYLVTKDKGILNISCEGYQNYKESKLFTFGNYEHKQIETTIVRDWAGTYRDGEPYQYFRPTAVVDSRLTPASGQYSVRNPAYGCGWLKWGNMMPFTSDPYTNHSVVPFYQITYSGFQIFMKTPSDTPITETLRVFVEIIDGEGKGASLPMSITPWISHTDSENDGYTDEIYKSPIKGHAYFVYAPIADWNSSIGFKYGDNLSEINGSSVVRISKMSRSFEVDSSFDLAENTIYTKDEDSDYIPVSSSIISRTGNTVAIKPTSLMWSEVDVLPSVCTFYPYTSNSRDNNAYLSLGTPSDLCLGESVVTWHQSTMSTEPALNLQLVFDGAKKGYSKYKLVIKFNPVTRLNDVGISIYATDRQWTAQNYNADSSATALVLNGNNTRKYQDAALNWYFEAELNEEDLFQEFFDGFGLSLYLDYIPTSGNSHLLTINSINLTQITRQDVNVGEVYISGESDLSALELDAHGSEIVTSNGGNLYQKQSHLTAWQEFAKSEMVAVQQIEGAPKYLQISKDAEPIVIDRIKTVSSLTDLRDNYLGNDWTITFSDDKKRTLDELKAGANIYFEPNDNGGFTVELFGDSIWFPGLPIPYTNYKRYIIPILEASRTKYKSTVNLDLSFPTLTPSKFEAIAQRYAEWTSIVKKETKVTVPYTHTVASSIYLGDRVTFNHPDILLNAPVIGYVTGKDIDFIKNEIIYKIWLTTYADYTNFLIDQGFTSSSDILVDSGTDTIVENG